MVSHKENKNISTSECEIKKVLGVYENASHQRREKKREQKRIRNGKINKVKKGDLNQISLDLMQEKE